MKILIVHLILSTVVQLYAGAAHQAVVANRQALLLECGGFDEILGVHIIDEDVLTTNAAVQDGIDRSRICNP